jgi:hypothetical protein
MNYIRMIDDRPGIYYPTLQVKNGKAADNIVRCLIENGIMVQREPEVKND